LGLKQIDLKFLGMILISNFGYITQLFGSYEELKAITARIDSFIQTSEKIETLL
jgi:hypothetical protein